MIEEGHVKYTKQIDQKESSVQLWKPAHQLGLPALSTLFFNAIVGSVSTPPPHPSTLWPSSAAHRVLQHMEPCSANQKRTAASAIGVVLVVAWQIANVDKLKSRVFTDLSGVDLRSRRE